MPELNLMAKEKKKSHGQGKSKPFAAKRTMNPTGGTNQGGHQGQTPDVQSANFQHRDPEHRHGSYEQKGEHARTGNPGHS